MSQTVRIDSVVKRYGDFTAVDNISLDIKEGEFFTLLGPSGCGKTTLLRMVAGFNEIDEGQIYFNDSVINNVPAHKRNIGMVFQNYAIFPHLSVRQNIEYGLKARGIRGDELRSRADEVMNMMQIYPYADRSPSQLSGGQQQRVALARAITIYPGVLLMDEPLSNLDAKLRVQMRTSIRRIQKKLNITTIYVTHDQEEALAISDRIAVMNKGKIEQLGKPRDIYKNPSNQFVANFIGVSGFIEGVATDEGIKILDKKVIDIKLKDDYKGPVVISVRPENGRIDEYDDNELNGTITMSTFLGDYINYEVQLKDGPTIEINEYTDQIEKIREIGDKISLKLSKDRITVFDSETKTSLMPE